MEEEKLENLKKAWYDNDGVLFEIIKNLGARETAIIGQSRQRNIKAHTIAYLKSNFKAFNFIGRKFNLYNSLALFKNFPLFPYYYQQRKKKQEEFRTTYKDYMIGYDFLLDIDSKEKPEFSYAVTWKVKEIFDKYKVRYYLLYSAGKNNGFHIRVSYEDLPEIYKAMNYTELCNIFKRFVLRLGNIHNLIFIDDTITDLRRVAKCPYSVVYPFYKIALPLSNSEFENFDVRKTYLEYWIKNIDKIRYRGLLKREGEPENFKRLIDDVMAE